MNMRRTGLALMLALLISGGLTWTLDHTSRKSKVVESRPLRRILVAKKDIAAGERLNSEDLTLTEWAAQEALPGSVNDLAGVVGRVALVSMMSGEPILSRRLASPGSGRGVAATIPPGTRAVTFRGPELSSLSSFAGPGDLVDVLTTDHAGSPANLAPMTVLEAVQILAVDDRISPDDNREPTPISSVTLLVPASDVPGLHRAMTGGTIVFALRNGTDTARGVYEVEASLRAKSLAQTQAPSLSAECRSETQKTAPETFTVETVAGGKATSQTFEEASQ